MEKLQKRADLVHLKDYRIVMPPEGVSGEEHSPKVVQFAEIGTGSPDMTGIINACIRISAESIKRLGFTECF